MALLPNHSEYTFNEQSTSNLYYTPTFKQPSRWVGFCRSNVQGPGQGKRGQVVITVVEVGHIARNYTQPKRPQNSNYFKDKMLLMQAQENGAVLDEEELHLLMNATLLIQEVDVEPTAQTFIHEPICPLAGSAKPTSGVVHLIASIYLRQAKKAQPVLYDGDELLKPHHVPVIVPSSVEELELAETTRNKLHVKMNDSACVEKRVKMSLTNYSKENFMANSPSGSMTLEAKKNSDADPTLDLKALVSQNKDLTAKLNALHDLNERFRAENAKVKQHYKELYDSIKITRAKTTDQNNSLLSEIENLKAQLKDNSKCVTIPDSKPKVLAPGR
ncbi:hypothetical protein Tco_1082092 [Tanacetum coccineum]|uniref:Uncharacterized protein n=1 Tax=Tanacetum coccineum TaxID=301880 RepID=A0ABQ5I1J6_9ASTR